MKAFLVSNWFWLIPSGLVALNFLAKLTPTKKDDAVVGKLIKSYREVMNVKLTGNHKKVEDDGEKTTGTEKNNP